MPHTLAWLKRHDWPGNVRELENWVHRELLLADGEEIQADAGLASEAAPPAPRAPGGDLRTAKAQALAEFESAYLASVLAESRRKRHRGRPPRRERAAHLRQVVEEYCIDRSHYKN